MNGFCEFLEWLVYNDFDSYCRPMNQLLGDKFERIVLVSRFFHLHTDDLKSPHDPPAYRRYIDLSVRVSGYDLGSTLSNSRTYIVIRLVFTH